MGGALEKDAVRILNDIPDVVIDPKLSTNRPGDVVIRAGDVNKNVNRPGAPGGSSC